MKATADDIADSLSDLASSYAENVRAISGNDGNLRTGVLKSAVKETVWAFVEAFPDDAHEISDMLDILAGLVREQEG